MKCPKCQGVRVSTERRPNGNNICGSCNHVWPSIKAAPVTPDQAVIENNFSYHSPKNGQPIKYETLRNKAKELAYLIDELCPKSREKSLANTKLEEAIMWANASVARNE